MSNRAAHPSVSVEERAQPDSNRSAVTLTVVILAIMAVAIAIDASSAPGLSVLAILLFGGIIAALMAWG